VETRKSTPGIRAHGLMDVLCLAHRGEYESMADVVRRFQPIIRQLAQSGGRNGDGAVQDLIIALIVATLRRPPGLCVRLIAESYIRARGSTQ